MSGPLGPLKDAFNVVVDAVDPLLAPIWSTIWPASSSSSSSWASSWWPGSSSAAAAAASSSSAPRSFSLLQLAMLGIGAYTVYYLVRFRRQRSLNGKICIVTGASSGIGQATSILMAKKGARVVLLARSADKLSETVERIRALGHTASHYAVDCGDGAAVQSTAERILHDVGVPDVIVNCAGAGSWRFLEQTSVQELESAMRAPFFAAAYVTKSFMPMLLAKKKSQQTPTPQPATTTSQWSAIVNINSPACFSPWPASTAYAASRAALRGLNDALAADCRGTNITVTHVVLGETESSYFTANEATTLPAIAALLPKYLPSQCAHIIVDAIERRRHEVIAPFLLKTMYWLNQLMPSVVALVVSYPHARGLLRD